MLEKLVKMFSVRVASVILDLNMLLINSKKIRVKVGIFIMLFKKAWENCNMCKKYDEIKSDFFWIQKNFFLLL